MRFTRGGGGGGGGRNVRSQSTVSTFKLLHPATAGKRLITLAGLKVWLSIIDDWD